MVDTLGLWTTDVKTYVMGWLLVIIGVPNLEKEGLQIVGQCTGFMTIPNSWT